MNNIELLQKTIVYIEDQLYEPMDYSKMGDYLDENPYSINQTFLMIVGMNIEDYIHHRKMTEAAKKLLNGNYRLIDIANRYGYKTAHEFSAAFSAHHNISPIQVRSNPELLKMTERIYIQLSTTTLPPMHYTIQSINATKLTGVVEFVQFEEISNNFLIPDIIYELKEQQIIKSLLSFSTDNKIYVVVEPRNDKIKIFTGVKSERTFDYDTTQIYSGDYAIFQNSGELDYAFNEIWHSVEKQVDFNIQYIRDTQYIYVFPEDMDFNNSFNKIELWLPVQK
ncbi:helix-turn-helix domain-containing protein [Macrococcoides caseolyticum]|uniref:helix-turn-helix domain-containing protein n=1 Tax=Macrococcoides caseolyticum TaxID=69966 RepID=UPI001F3D8E55|nr:helix-turn-helix domain-containing protein [Macrococcus caseolyticus]MCE4957108.1 AraC family transcriptional regulator [Macrococcus caseolyticus]